MDSGIRAEIIIFEQHYIYIVIALLLIGCIYFFSKKFVLWGMAKGLGYMLSYVVGSLLFINIYFIFLVFFNQEARLGHLLPYLLQTVGLFGFILAVGNSFKYLFKKLSEKKA